MKRVISILLSIIAVACLVACSTADKNDDATQAETKKTTLVTTTRMSTEEAKIKDEEALNLIQSYSAKELKLTDDDMKECSFMIAKYGESIDDEKYVKVVATVKTEIKDKDGEISYTLDNKGEYFIRFDGKKILVKNLDDNTYSQLGIKQ